MSERDLRHATARVLDPDVGAEDTMTRTLYTGGKEDDEAGKRETKPVHYKVICISMYTEDLRRLDRMVESLKARGLTKANRSALIRYALGEVDLERVPKGL